MLLQFRSPPLIVHSIDQMRREGINVRNLERILSPDDHISSFVVQIIGQHTGKRSQQFSIAAECGGRIFLIFRLSHIVRLVSGKQEVFASFVGIDKVIKHRRQKLLRSRIHDTEFII